MPTFLNNQPSIKRDELNPKDISSLISVIEENKLWETSKEVRRNEYLKTAGSIDTNLYYIEKGSFKIYIIEADKEHIIRVGYPQNLLAALDSFITEQPSKYYIQALKKSSVKIISKKTLQALIDSNPLWTSWWINVLEMLILQQLEREIDLLVASPLERYNRVLQRSPQIFQEIPNKYIADYLRMTPETLSRIKKT